MSNFHYIRCMDNGLCSYSDCGTFKCENAYICENVAKREKISTLNVKIDVICEKND